MDIASSALASKNGALRLVEVFVVVVVVEELSLPPASCSLEHTAVPSS